ncbi:MAG: bifunctional pyr operon transcriptional regulator/uracil phosphoribosyltransferase PyrR [Phycisphaerales bacterium]|jgi:pyrimidine operon attenuation protein / uracil phosphoribosyltransferase|nr:bifunctional pyr operon transcriptional regulator/uracil phosphoribosyltransferase PyrR [Phycisphaerales bacterium]
MNKLLTKTQMEQVFDRLYSQVTAALPAEGDIAIIGIRSNGVPLAERISDRLVAKFPKRTIHSGALDVTFYRDDLKTRTSIPVARSAELNFDVDGTWILLVDDVLQTGRTIRAALTELHDFGRPAAVRLAVLIDRGGHQLPITADMIGATMDIPIDQKVKVQLEETDGQEGAYGIETQ